MQQAEAMKARLLKAEKDLGNVELIMGPANNAQEVAALLKKAGAAAGVGGQPEYLCADADGAADPGGWTCDGIVFAAGQRA